MRQIALYGKGGIGKSTVGSNVAAALAEKGLNVMMIGCDPKHDCTRNLRDGKEVPTILDTIRNADLERYGVKELIEGLRVVELEDIVIEGYRGIYCAEAGGPKPGVGCAGRGVIAAIETLKRLKAFETLNPDIVLYDVLGDVVCGGFAMPLRMGLADEVYIVTSSDYMSLYAANNICLGIEEFVDRGGSPVGGVIYNVRGAASLDEVVQDFALRIGSRIVGKVPHDSLFAEAEAQRKTVIEYAPSSELADLFRKLAWDIYENSHASKPKSLNTDEMSALSSLIGDSARGLHSGDIQ
jgi:nitrogenase iron protein NifH